jgi:hypothetical protein
VPLVNGLRPSVEIEGLLIDFFGPLLGDSCYVSTIVPPAIEWTDKTAVRFARTSGAPKNRFVDHPIINADVFGHDTATAVAISQQIFDTMQGIRNLIVSDGIVQWVETVIGPRWLPEDNQSLVRRSATYEMHTHPGPNS